MNEHVVTYQQSGHPEGLIGTLEAHRPDPLDWTDDGLTSAPDNQCSAIVVDTARCGKQSSVVLFARTKYARVGGYQHDVFLCGGHFNAHRRGAVVRIVVTAARAAQG